MLPIRIPKKPLILAGYCLLAAVLLARIVYVITRIDVSTTLENLPLQYHQRAEALLSGTRLPFAEAWGLFYVPLAWFYAAFDLLGLSTMRVQSFVVVQAIMGTAAVMFCYLLSRRLTGRTPSILIALVAALYYPLIYTHTLILSETLFTMLFLGSLLLLFQKKHTLLSSMALGYLFALLVITRPIFLSSIPVLLLWAIWYHRAALLRHRGWIAGGLASMAFLALVACTLNAQISFFRHFTLAGNGGVNVAMTQCQLRKLEYKLDDGSENFWFAPPVYSRTEHESKVTNVPFSDQLYYLRMGIGCLAAHPERLIENFANIYRMYDSKFYPDLGTPSYHDALLDLWKPVSLSATVLFLLFPLFWTKGEQKRYTLLCGLLLSLFATMYLANPGEERYSIPYFFMLLPYAILTIERGWGALNRSIRRIVKVEKISS